MILIGLIVGILGAAMKSKLLAGLGVALVLLHIVIVVAP